MGGSGGRIKDDVCAAGEARWAGGAAVDFRGFDRVDEGGAGGGVAGGEGEPASGRG